MTEMDSLMDSVLLATGGGAGGRAYSPLALEWALRMLAQGARGTTQAQLAAVIGTAGDESMPAGDGTYTLSASLWHAAQARLRASYRDLAAGWKAEVRGVDFTAPAAAAAINSWIAGQTGGRIIQAVDPDDLDAMTRMVLVDTLFFKGGWRDPFDADDRHAGFEAPGGRRQVRMLDGRADRYFESEELQGIAKRYRHGGRFIAVKRKDGAPAAPTGLALGKIKAALAQAGHYDEIDLALPVFRFDDDLRLVGPLRKLGVHDAFDFERADFGGMFEQPQGIFVSQLFQKVHVDVNRLGTEACAATVAEMILGMARAPQARRVVAVTFDRPFVFYIVDAAGRPLFCGRIDDPS